MKTGDKVKLTEPHDFLNLRDVTLTVALVDGPVVAVTGPGITGQAWFKIECVEKVA